MSWARIDDGFYSNRKVVPLVNRGDALNVWVRLLSWCHHQRSKGRIPLAVARTFGTPKALKKLVESGLFDRDEDGYVFHDFEEYLPRGEAREIAPEVSEARRAAGQKGAAARWQGDSKPADAAMANADGNSVANADGKDGSRAEAPADAPARAPTRSRPDPSRPDPKRESALAPLQGGAWKIREELRRRSDLFPGEDLDELAVACEQVLAAEPKAREVDRSQVGAEAVAWAGQQRAKFALRTPQQLTEDVRTKVAWILRDVRLGNWKPAKAGTADRPAQGVDLQHELDQMQRTEASSSSSPRAREPREPTRVGDVTSAIAGLAAARRSGT